MSTSQQIKDCIEACGQCAKTCLETLPYCAMKGGKHAEPHHLGLLMDCANVCEISVKLMLNHSDYQHRFCELCAEICTQCAEDCGQFTEDEMMKKCALTCRSCADACREMSSKRQAA